MYSDPSGRSWNSFWEGVWDWTNTFLGLLNPTSKLTFESAIIVAMINGRWEELKKDWNNGCFNPLNQDASTALKANIASFYKGSTVVRQGLIGSCSIFGTIWNDGDLDEIGMQHEWGHSIQERILGPSYYLLVGVPSAINCKFGRYRDPKYSYAESDIIYYSKVWERSADWLGGVSRNYYSFFTFDNFIPW